MRIVVGLDSVKKKGGNAAAIKCESHGSKKLPSSSLIEFKSSKRNEESLFSEQENELTSDSYSLPHFYPLLPH